MFLIKVNSLKLNIEFLRVVLVCLGKDVLLVKVIRIGVCLRRRCSMNRVEFYLVVILNRSLCFILLLLNSNFCFLCSIFVMLLDLWKKFISVLVFFKILVILGNDREFFIIRLIRCL